MRKSIITAVMALALAALPSAMGSAAPAEDSDPAVTVKDVPGAPRDMLLQLEKLTGERAVVRQVMAVDAGGERLTLDQAEALAAGKVPDGVKMLGVMPADERLLDTTLSDLSDGTYDGPRDSAEYFRSAVVFDLFLPGYEWCLTMCVSSGRSVAECIRLSRS